jgi:hypothetical protein
VPQPTTPPRGMSVGAQNVPCADRVKYAQQTSVERS